ncbi:hypothetical protein AiwAL_14705 [Acidiphilium sp. AL]|uniref:Transposase n=1 Tax=Acidiphilium iwatense TaxID=768198 RepID=A0ABS9DZP4_9PROT|nr:MULTISPECIES: hypothetical protein [Acidiphilium]MCF3948227.1 hypothetical protein [Acidiphilium iwatense]MCU4161337.1 hypothetical protein [Acidiphilium sp. AL]
MPTLRCASSDPSDRRNLAQLRSAAIARFLGTLPRDLAGSFTEAQLAAIDLHFAMRYRVGHAVDFRRRIGFARFRAYVVVLIGREHRAE